MITAIVLTKNEEKNIIDCIESLSFCDEVVVIDDNSDDRTKELAEKSKAKVFIRSLEKDFATQRNFGLRKAQGDWILFVDADERVSSSLRDEIKSEIRSTKFETIAYKIQRTDFMWGRELKYGEAGNVKLVRLAKKETGKWEGKVHERWVVKGKTGQLENPLHHFPHQGVGEFLREINFYTDIRARELFDKNVKTYWWSIILYPKAKFIINYLVHQGFRDGLPGLVFALVMSFHSFLVRAKLWLLWKKQ